MAMFKNKLRSLSQCSLLFAASANAAVIIPTIDSQTVSGGFAGTNTGRLTDNAGLFNSAGVGVTVANGASLADAMAVYSEWDGNGHASGWVSNEESGERIIVWDLAQDTDLANLVLWKYGNTGGASNSLENFSLHFNTESQGATTFSGAATNLTLDFPDPASSTTLTSGQVAQAAQVFALGSVTARYVQMTMIDGYNNSRVAFNEIRFDSVAVPEPSSAVLLGLGGISLLLYRRK